MPYLKAGFFLVTEEKNLFLNNYCYYRLLVKNIFFIVKTIKICVVKHFKYIFWIILKKHQETRCKIASNLLFINVRKFHHSISVSVLLYIPCLLLSFPRLPPTHSSMCLLVCTSVRYSFKSNFIVKISFSVRLFLMTYLNAELWIWIENE